MIRPEVQLQARKLLLTLGVGGNQAPRPSQEGTYPVVIAEAGGVEGGHPSATQHTAESADEMEPVQLEEATPVSLEATADPFSAIASKDEPLNLGQALKEQKRYGGGAEEVRALGRGEDYPHSHFGITIVSCEHADIRQSLHGLYIYGDDGQQEVPVAKANRGREAELEELYSAVIEDRPVFHDGRWGEATLEVVLAIMQSARERQEIFLSHQVPSRE